MAYKNIRNKILSPAQNPYAASGSAISIAGQDFQHPIAEIETVTALLERVRRALQYETEPVRFFFVGEYGSGKSTRLNLVRREFLSASRSLCIPIKFQKIANQIMLAGNPKLSPLVNLYGIILENIIDSLIEQKALNREESNDLKRQTTKPNLMDLICKLLRATNRDNILMIFDEVEFLFLGLKINVSDFMNFMHNLSETLSEENRRWGLCVSVTPEYLIDIRREAAQLKDARFDFIIAEPLNEIEIFDYIEKKNSSVTQRLDDKLYPFNNDVVRFMASVSGGMPRNLEVLGHLMWDSKADESFTGSVDIETAKRVYINKYKPKANAYFSYLCRQLGLPVEAESFLNILFLQGGYRLTVQQLVNNRHNSYVKYLSNRIDSEAHNILYRGSRLIRDCGELETIVEIKRVKSYQFSLTDRAYRNIYDFELEGDLSSL